MSKLAATLLAFIEALPDPRFNDESAIIEIQTTVTRMALAIEGGCHMPNPPKVDIFVRPDRTYYWNLGYANGLTYRPTCMHIMVGPDRTLCGAEATRMVTPYSLCEEHAIAEEAEREAHRRFCEEYANSPEGRREVAAEMAWEARVS